MIIGGVEETCQHGETTRSEILTALFPPTCSVYDRHKETRIYDRIESRKILRRILSKGTPCTLSPELFSLLHAHGGQMGATSWNIKNVRKRLTRTHRSRLPYPLQDLWPSARSAGETSRKGRLR